MSMENIFLAHPLKMSMNGAHRRFELHMPHLLLDGEKSGALFDQVRSQTVPPDLLTLSMVPQTSASCSAPWQENCRARALSVIQMAYHVIHQNDLKL